jgi:hypothetical protein
LEVNHDYEGLQVDPNGAYPQPGIEAEKFTHHYDVTDTTKVRKEGICGLKRRTFFIVLIVAIVVVCGAVGGGVGGYFGTKGSSESTSESTSTSTPTPTQASTQRYVQCFS